MAILVEFLVTNKCMFFDSPHTVLQKLASVGIEDKHLSNVILEITKQFKNNKQSIFDFTLANGNKIRLTDRQSCLGQKFNLGGEL